MIMKSVHTNVHMYVYVWIFTYILEIFECMCVSSI